MVLILYIETILIAISLSMDAFSLAISLSTLKLKNIKVYRYAFMVGLFHFIMPIGGNLLRKIIDKIIIVPSKTLFIIIIIFIIIGILLDKENNISKKILNPILFAFIVSIDSFSVGVSLSKSILIISCSIFSVTSSLFTLIGFKIGNIIYNNSTKYTKFISISILIILIILKLI